MLSINIDNYGCKNCYFKFDEESMKKFSELRENYSEKKSFELENLPNNPLDFFKIWYDEILKMNIKDSNAMNLSTCSPNGFPQSRFVLLKELTQNGFIFYTNYNSKKGKDIDLSNKVSLNFWWKETEQQVRVLGYAYKLSVEKSKTYFRSRPQDSQVAAFISHQSNELKSRDYLENRFFETKKKFSHQEIPYPHEWGGYRVEPIEVEFWKGREARLHDRVVYKYDSLNNWTKNLLWP